MSAEEITNVCLSCLRKEMVDGRSVMYLCRYRPISYAGLMDVRPTYLPTEMAVQLILPAAAHNEVYHPVGEGNEPPNRNHRGAPFGILA